MTSAVPAQPLSRNLLEQARSLTTRDRMVILGVALIGLAALVGGWWMALMVVALYLIALAVGLVLGGFALGRFLLRSVEKAGNVWAMVLGLAIVWVASVVPFVGWLATPIAMVVGLGAGSQALMDSTGAADTMRARPDLPPPAAPDVPEA